MSGRQVLAVIVAALIAAAAVASVLPSRAGATTGLKPSAAAVKLVIAPAKLRDECSAAANQLRFAVPCPMRVPGRHGRGMLCAGPTPEAPVACVGLEGLPQYQVFGLGFSGFDVPRRYVGVDGKPEGHVTIEARRQTNSPSLPCIGGEPLGSVLVAGRTAAEYRCPGDARRVQREARHGEGSYLGHLLLAWSENGIDYIVSAHGHTKANLDLIRRLIESMAFVAPAGPESRQNCCDLRGSMHRAFRSSCIDREVLVWSGCRSVRRKTSFGSRRWGCRAG